MQKLFAYQNAGVQYLIQGKHKLLLWEMGTGKTPVSVTALCRMKVTKVCVICPAIARTNWQRELSLWGYEGQSIIESYDMLRRDSLREEIEAFSPEVLILDEGHYLKNPTAKRTQHVYGAEGIARHAGVIWVLSGTLAPNNPSELYPHLAALFHQYLTPSQKKFYSFRQYFCQLRSFSTNAGKTFMKVVGNRNSSELRSILDAVASRKKLRDVELELPALFHTNVYCEESKDLRAYLSTEEGQLAQKELRLLLRETMSQDALTVGVLAQLRRMLAEAKAPFAIEWIEDFLTSGRKLIVFGHHRLPLLQIANKISNSRIVLGGTTEKDRVKAIDDFQTDPTVRLFVAQLTAASTAVTLTAAADMLFLEQSWTPAVNRQAAKRAHRIGQTRPVHVRNLVIANSVDEAVAEALAMKTEMLSELELA
jgi:SNF2 family DNA or RNA helicase